MFAAFVWHTRTPRTQVKTASATYSADLRHATDLCMHVLNRARGMAMEGKCPYTAADPYMDWAHFSEAVGGLDADRLWAGIVRATVRAHVKTLDTMNALTKPCVSEQGGCFNLWGFDYMLTSDFNVALLEVNALPLLNNQPHHNKTLVVLDALNILGVGGFDRSDYLVQFEARVERLCASPAVRLLCTPERLDQLLRWQDEEQHSGTYEPLYPTQEHTAPESEMQRLFEAEVTARGQREWNRLVQAWFELLEGEVD